MRVLPDTNRLARAAADHFIELARQAIQARGRFSVALAGGSTPRALYALLAQASLDWPQIDLFWGDERCVPPDHPDSNYRMVREALLDHIPIPAQNLHRMRGELPPQQAAAEYEAELRAYFGEPSAISGQPSAISDQQSTISNQKSAIPNSPFTIHNSPFLDLILLGLGEDGHTASLFPGTPALEEKARWVVAVEHNQPPLPLVDRISLTLPAINAARQVVFLVAGANKAGVLKRILAPTSDPQEILPARRVQPTSGRLLWLLDQDAASLL